MIEKLLPHLPSFLLAVAVAYLLALVVYPLVKLRSPYNLFAISGLLMGIIECPHFISTDQVPLRGVAALFCGDLLFRAVDFLRQHHAAPGNISWRDYALFLIPFPLLLVVFKSKQRRLTSSPVLRQELPRLVIGALAVATAFAFALAAHGSETLARNFLLDHLLTIGLWLLLVESAAQFLLALEHLAGFDTQPIVMRCFLSKTPAEFWIRYNQRVQQWLYYNVFLPSGGRRHPARGVMVVFLVSAIFHELMFGLVTSRFDGYQAAFFLLQIPAVLISYPMAELAMRYGTIGKTTARLLTILWFVLTSMLFLHGADRVFPFVYVAKPWLP